MTDAGLDPALVDRVRRRLADTAEPSAPPSLARAVRHEHTGVHGDGQLLEAVRVLEAELGGAGPLSPLLADPDVADILVNGPDETWVDRGRGLQRVSIRFRNEAQVRQLAVRLVAVTGRRLDDAAPWADARLADGTRVHAVLPPISVRGTVISLRAFRPRGWSVAELEDAGSLAPGIRGWLEAAVAARLAIVVTGGTGSGKTSLLGALLGLVEPSERCIVIEDAAELRARHPHLIRLEARSPNLEGAGAVDLRDLVRQALRMRPDRIVLGEARGPELLDLLVALNSGHDGGMTTVHANRAVDLPARCEALAALGGLGRVELHSLLAVALHVVVHLVRGPGGRRLGQVGVLRRGDDGLVSCLPALTVTSSGEVTTGVGLTALEALLGQRS